MRLFLGVLFALMLAFPAQAAFNDGSNNYGGGFSGPGSMNASTVQAAKKMRDDSKVTLTGNIVQRIGGDKYIFRDATGEITIEIDDKDFRGQNVTPQNLVRIFGEVEKEFGSGVEIDVKRLDVVR